MANSLDTHIFTEVTVQKSPLFLLHKQLTIEGLGGSYN
jgi:hypothetical protein